ncbi:MAG: DNA alkylation repair protein, partial [Bacteroidetes bacterium HGW-Bacteroidetes-22]
DSGHLWLQRSCLLFQLKHKDKLDFELLRSFITRLNTHPDFFIRKAIGWSLRSYARQNPEGVKQFVASTALSNLSRREALKHLADN